MGNDGRFKYLTLAEENMRKRGLLMSSPSTSGDYLDRKKQELDSKLEVEKKKTELAQVEADRIEHEQRAENLRNQGIRIAPGAIDGILSMAQVNPQKAKEFIESLSEEDMNKIILLQQANDPRLAPLISRLQDNTPVRDVVELVKLVIPPAAQYGNQPQGQQVVVDVGKILEVAMNNRNQNADQLTVYKEVIQPMLTEMGKIREDFGKVQIGMLENKIDKLEGAVQNRPSLAEELQDAKSKLETVGLWQNQPQTPGGTTPETRKMELDFQKWKVEQEFANTKWRFEQDVELEKWRSQSQAERKKWDTIIDKVVRPTLGKAKPLIDTAIEEAQAKIKGSKNAAQTPPNRLTTFPCTNCGTQIPIPNPTPSTLTCSKCQHVYTAQ